MAEQFLNLKPIDAFRPGEFMDMAPQMNLAQPSNGWFGIEGIGKNLDTLKLGLGGLQALGGLWSASQQNKLAKQSFNFQKGILDTNLANSIKSYNLGIDDKFRSRAVVEGMSPADRDAAIARWQATDQRRV